MLKLYVAESCCALIDALAEAVAPKARGLEGKNFIFTEEKTTLITERAILKRVGGTFNTRVFSMRRFLKSLYEPKDLLSKEGSVMLLRKIIGERAEELSCLKRARRKSLAPAVYECIAQLKSAKVGAEKLRAAAARAEGLLKDKLSDIALLYEAYENAIDGRYKDQSNYLAALPALAERGVKGADVYVAAYSSFTRQEIEVVKSFMRCARSVTGYLVSGENEFAYTSEAAEAYRRAAREVGEELEIVSLGGEEGVQRTILQNIFNPSAFAAPPVETNQIFMYEAASAADEAEHIASIIKRDVIDGKMRYSDAEVALGGASPAALKKAFGEYGIPYFLDEKRSLSEHAAARFALDFFTAFRRGYALEDMLALVKNPLVFPMDFADGFENYLLRYGYSRSMFFRPFRYGRSEPDFGSYESARERVAALFAPLKRKMSAKGFTDALRGALESLSAADSGAELAAAYEREGYLQEAAFTAQGFDKLGALLDETDKLLGGHVLDIDEFRDILASGFAADEIAVLPQYADAVYVGAFRETRLVKAKTLFLAGLADGVPAVKNDVAMLTDADLEKLEDLKVFVEPKISAVNRRERENAALAAAAFSERLYLSCSAVGENGKPQLKSEMFDYFSAMFVSKGRPVAPMSAALVRSFYAAAGEEARRRLDAMLYLTPAQAKKAFARQINAFREGECDLTAASAYYRLTSGGDREIADAMLASANSEMTLRLKSNREVVLREGRLSASVLQAYYACPYRNFLVNGLGLKERKTGDVPTETGNFFHSVFEKFAPEAARFENEEEALAFAFSLAEETARDEVYARLEESSSGRDMLARMKSEAAHYCVRIYRQYKYSDFELLGQEVWFGKKSKRYKAIELSAGGRKYYIEGKVDRIDKKGDYIRIVDYKTGSFSKADKDLFVGKDIQIYLYMNAFAGLHKPAGVYYCNVSDDYIADKDKKEDFFGHTLEDKEIIFASDRNLSIEHPESEMTGIKIGVKKDGEITLRGGRMLTREEFDGYLKYALLIAEKGAERLSEGVIAASPYKGACDYCAFGGMCPFFADGAAEERDEDVVRSETIVAAAKNACREDGDGT